MEIKKIQEIIDKCSENKKKIDKYIEIGNRKHRRLVKFSKKQKLDREKVHKNNYFKNLYDI